MPGTILKLVAAPGDVVRAGQALLVMESMKMEMTVEAPQAGRVAEIHCRPGELVPTGARLVRLEGVDEPSE